MTTAPRICFLSTMCLLDPVSGAAQSARNILETLADAGFRATAFTASLFDSNAEVDYGVQLGKQASASKGELVQIPCNGVEHSVFMTASSLGRKMTAEERQKLMATWRRYVSEIQPDIILSFGTSQLASEMRDAARRIGAKIVFYLGNADIKESDFVRPGDTGVCPSRYLADLYASRFGIQTAVINPVISPLTLVEPGTGIGARPETRRLGFVTFVNPLPHKGLTLVARLIGRALDERPDMRFLLLEGRMPRHLLKRLKLDLPGLSNVWWLPEQRDMAAVYARTAVLLVPSFWTEGFGRSVVEAQLSSIPVLASNRGGLHEALGEGPQPLPVDQRCIENHYAVPSPETVDLWWRTLLKLWDDDNAYTAASRLARQASEPYAPEKTRARVIDHFKGIAGLDREHTG